MRQGVVLAALRRGTRLPLVRVLGDMPKRAVLIDLLRAAGLGDL